MPRRAGYSRRPRARRRLVGNRQVAVYNPATGLGPRRINPRTGQSYRLRLGNQGLSQLHSPMHLNTLAAAVDTVQNWSKMAGMLKSRANVKALKQTNLVKRGKANAHNRHEELNTFQANNKVPTGKGSGKTRPTGVLTTHGVGRVPRWKLKRLNTYKHNVFQTVLLSKSNRLPGSQNFLENARYPIKAPECLDSERIQSMVFTPFCSHFSGVHSTLFRKVQSDGTDIDHDTSARLDVIQNKADIARQELPASVDGTGGSAIVYESDYAGGAITAATARGATNRAEIVTYIDQLVKGVNVNLVFWSSRSYDMKIGVSVVRKIVASTPNDMTADDKKNLLNNMDYKGIPYSDYRVEWNHQFVLKGLKKGKKPPTYSVNKKLRCNWLQSNTFQSDTASQAMSQANTNLLGKNINVRQDETADGDMSSQFFVIIKYRKVQAPQQFTYIQNIQSNSSGANLAQIELPVISEESFDVPTVTGSNAIQVGTTPFETSQGDESKGSFYVHGKIVYNWGFRREPEAIPSLVSSDPSHADYKKAQSLMIDPTYTADDTHGIYTESPDHVQLAANTSGTGP